MSINVITLFASIASVTGVIIALVSLTRTSKKDSKCEGKEDGALKADTEYIKRRVDDVLLEQKDTNKSLNALSDRVSKVEESAKSAHHRIDEIKDELKERRNAN